MSFGAFTEKERLPCRQEMLKLLGKAATQWMELAKWVEEKYRVEGEGKFYGKNYGWALRFRKGGKGLVSLYPNKGFLTAQIVLSTSAVEESRSMNLKKTARQTIDRAHPYPEGRWVFLRIGSKSDAADAEKLLVLKSGIPVNPSRPAIRPVK